MIYDTLKLSRALNKTFTAEQADSLVEALIAIQPDSRDLSHLATKADLNDLRLAMKADMADQKVDMIKWIVGAIAFNFFGLAGLIVTLVKLFGKT